MVVGVGKITLRLVLLSERDYTRTWKREDGRENPDFQTIFNEPLLLARGSTRQNTTLDVIRDERTTDIPLQRTMFMRSLSTVSDNRMTIAIPCTRLHGSKTSWTWSVANAYHLLLFGEQCSRVHCQSSVKTHQHYGMRPVTRFFLHAIAQDKSCFAYMSRNALAAC